MGKVPAAHLRAVDPTESAGFSPPEGPSAFQRELDRARRHLAKLEAEDRARRRQPLVPEDHTALDESPTFVRLCNVAIVAIMLLPVVLAVLALVRRIAG